MWCKMQFSHHIILTDTGIGKASFKLDHRKSYRPVFSSLLFCLFTHNNTALEKFNLTRRERQVAELLLRGKSADEISEELSISPNTAKVHVQRIYRKSNVTSRAEFLFIMNQYTV